MDTPSVPLKRCKTCHEWKPNAPKYYRFKGRWSEHECRKCYNLRRNRQRQTPSTKLQNRVDDDGYKVCGKCRQRLKWTQELFHKRGGRLSSCCKACRNSHNREYDRNHVEEHAAYGRRYRQLNPEKVAEKNRRWAELNPDRRRAIAKRYQKRHPETKRAGEAKRRARKRQNGGEFTGADIRLLSKSQKGKCWWCGIKLSTYHIDHRIPLSRGGSNAPENLCLTCPKCNLEKHNKLPQEWNGRLL